MSGSLKVNPKYASEFKFTQQNTGETPSGITVPHDSPSLPNFTATYTGKDLTTSTSFINLFTLDTTFAERTSGGSNFSGVDYKTSGLSTGTPVALFGFISTPTPKKDPPSSSLSTVPEPQSLLLLGIGTAVVFGATTAVGPTVARSPDHERGLRPVQSDAAPCRIQGAGKSWPGRPGWFPTQAPHTPNLRHVVQKYRIL